MTVIERLQCFIAENDGQLLLTLKVYARKSGLSQNQADAESIARELLSEVTVEALCHADRFDITRHPMSWLLGIAANMVKRRQASTSRLQRREPLLRDLYASQEHLLSDDELFDWLGLQTTNEDDRRGYEDEHLTTLLTQLSPDDQQVIQLAILRDLDGDSVAKVLGVAPGTARMRLHRALRRLRTLAEAESAPVQTQPNPLKGVFNNDDES